MFLYIVDLNGSDLVQDFSFVNGVRGISREFLYIIDSLEPESHNYCSSVSLVSSCRPGTCLAVTFT